MLQPIFYITAEAGALEAAAPAAQANNGCISLLASDTEQLRTHYLLCQQYATIPFSLTLQVDTAPDQPLIEAMLAFLFLPAFYKQHQRRILSLLGDNEVLLQQAKRLLTEAAAEQHIEMEIYSLRLFNSLAEAEKQLTGAFLFTSSEDFLQQLSLTWEGTIPAGSYYFVHDVQMGYAALLHKAAALENSYAAAHPQQYSLRRQLQEANNNNARLQQQLLATTTELANYKTHLEVLKLNHQAKELQDYYNNEYEILPTWFKRLGQIIKVIMGKRRFRSLFTDQ
ncbi:MAG TPA: hypothetical protein VL307_10450, partial [Chitinophagaceae bacterium]|nr:hypothetical protein [Chitinophagaceae bacterium]